MADINYEELEDLTLTMEDEDGTTTESELQFVFEYDGQDYGAFCEAENETGEFYFFSIDGSTNWKGETELEIAPVEDDALLEQLVDVLQQIIDSEMSDIERTTTVPLCRDGISLRDIFSHKGAFFICLCTLFTD